MKEGKSNSKEEITRNLTNIPSIGNLTAKALIKANFDSISKLKKAEVEDLTSIEHIGENLARKILEEVSDSFNTEEIEEKTTLEIRCPICDRFTRYEKDECAECEEHIELFSKVVLPDRGIIEDPKKTLAEVEDNILEDGGDAESWFIRGSILESMGANRKALESLDRVIELDPLFDHIWNAKAKVSLKIGETEDAAKAYKLAFDAQKAPQELADKIEELKASTSKKAIELEEKDEIDKELDEKISKARNLLRKIIDDDKKDISDLTSELDTVTEERIKGNKEKALNMITEVLKRAKSLSEDEVVDLSNKIEELDEFSEELSEKVKDITGIKDVVSKAEKEKEKGDMDEVSSLISGYLENKSSLRYISENLDEMISKKDKIENIEGKDGFVNEINQDFEKVKALCKNKEFQDAEDLFENILEKLEERLEYGEMIKDQYLNNIEKIIEKGKNKGFDLEMIKGDFDEAKEKFKTGKEDQEKIVDRFETIKQKGEQILSVKSNISEIEERISEHEELLDTNQYEEEIEKVEDLIKKEDLEKAVETSEELNSDLKTEIKDLEDEEVLKRKSEENLAEAREKLSKLRETDLELNEMKGLLKNANKARKKGDLQKSISLTENFIESANKMIDLSDLIEKIDKKIKKLDEKDLINKEKINYEIDQYKRLIKIEKYDLAEKLLSRTSKKLEEALNEEKIIPPPEEKLDDTATEIPTQIKEKVRNVKELNNLVERAEIEIKVNREPLKDAIIKIKDLEYREANKILTDWKESLIDRLNYELGDRLDTLREEFDELEALSANRRGEAILENIEKKWSLKAYEGALEALIYASSFIKDIQKKKTEVDTKVYLSSEMIEDIQGLDDDNKNLVELLNEAKNNKDKEEVFNEKIEKIKDEIEKNITRILSEEMENLEERLEEITQKKGIVAVSNLVNVKLSLDEDNLEKASWYMREYKNTIKEV